MGAKSQLTEIMGQSLSLNEFLQGIAASMVARGNGGNDVWPAPRLDLDRTLCALAPTILRDVACIPEAITSLEALRHPSAFAELCYYLLARPKDLAEAVQWQAAADFLARSIGYMRGDDIFCRSGNRIHAGFRVENSVVGPSTQPYEADRSYVGTAVALLNVYVELLHFAFVAFSKEIHGPYELNDRNWIIYEYEWLNGAHFDFSRKFPLRSVEIGLELYGQTPAFDFHGRYSGAAHHFRSFRGRCTTADGTTIPLDCVWLIGALTDAIRDATREMRSYEDEQLLRLLAVSQYEGLRNVTGGAFPRLGEGDLASYFTKYKDAASHEWLHRSLTASRTLSPQERESHLVALLDPRNLSKGLR